MSITYGSGIKLQETIGFESPAPLDNRVVVDTTADLDTILYTYTGLITYVTDIDALYIYNKTDGWHPYNTASMTTADTKADLENINQVLLKNGCLAYVNEEDKYYKYKDGEWTTASFGGGAEGSIPIYDQAAIDKLGGADNILNDYVYIGNKNTDLYNGHVENNVINTSTNGNYVDVMFSALRKLLSEVAKLKNSFNYGIYSYTDRHTAMSSTLKTYDEVTDDEPLWAVEEDDLALIEGLDEISLGETNTFIPKYAVQSSGKNKLKMLSEASWKDTDNILLGVEDSKIFTFMTTDSLDVSVCLVDIDNPTITVSDGTNITEKPNTIWVDLSQFHDDLEATTAYNIEVGVSRKLLLKKASGLSAAVYGGHNYIWVSIANFLNSETLVEGYIDPSTNNFYDSFENYPEKDSRLAPQSFRFGQGLELSKFNIYSKYQDFSNNIVPSKPDETGYAFKAAHITIRSVETYTVLNEILVLLPNNELIFVEDTQTLWIKNNDVLVQIASKSAGGSNIPGSNTGSGSGTDTGSSDNIMDREELISKLEELGIIYSSEDGNIEFNSVSDITFVNQASGKSFKYESDAYGNLVSTEILPSSKSLPARVLNASTGNAFVNPDTMADWPYRGFVATLRNYERRTEKDENGNNKGAIPLKNDFGLYADRIKIGAFYAPLEDDTVFGCTHAYIELENTSDVDFDLNGCYLHWFSQSTVTNDTKDPSFGEAVQANDFTGDKTKHLALTGLLKAGSTYLIRGKQYTDYTDNNAYILVSSYDLEWWTSDTAEGDKYLLDLTMYYQRDPEGNKTKLKNATAYAYRSYGFALTYGLPTCAHNTVLVTTNADTNTSEKAPKLYHPYFIDGVVYGNANTNTSWAAPAFTVSQSNSIVKNTFMLDPAKQAFQALTMYECSRNRWAKTSDLWIMSLKNEYISFPHTDEIYPVSKFTPKASFENKNVITDKTDIDTECPNMVTVSFGKNVYTTRCFNWISVGYFDEYVWLYKNNTLLGKFASYTKLSKNEPSQTIYPSRHVFANTTKYNGYEIVNIVYARITGKHFPGSNIKYTSHKCIIDLMSDADASNLTTPVTYTYIVGRADKNGNPDEAHISNEQSFTVYPKTYTPQIYQTSDQQGFHWLEYQVWAAAAIQLNDRIEFDKKYVLDYYDVEDADKAKIKETGTISNPTYSFNASDYAKPTGFDKFNAITSNRSTPIAIYAKYQKATYTAIASGSEYTGMAYILNSDKTYTELTYVKDDGKTYYKYSESDVRELYSVDKNNLDCIKNNGTVANPIWAWAKAPANIVNEAATEFELYNCTQQVKEYILTLTPYTYTATETTFGTDIITTIIDKSVYTTNTLQKDQYISYTTGTDGTVTIIYNLNISAGNYKITSIDVYDYVYVPNSVKTENKDYSKDITYTMSYYRTRKENEQIMPIFINTGDMTQNGTRINEWLDYYTGGKVLFNHIEQQNVVGNNDLCNTDVEALGTGDDEGKSNSYFYNLFYCYEVPTMVTHESGATFDVTPICKGKHIPSLYYFDTVDKRIYMINSEITPANCKGWFGLYETYPDGHERKENENAIINIYTGWDTPASGTRSDYHADFTSIYTMIYYTLKSANYELKQVITVCHEMPFTVITNGSIEYNSTSKMWVYSRCWNGKSNKSVIGSHMNQIGPLESECPNASIYWFSRLLEYFHVRLCLGGHKHTYAVTYPTRENFYWNTDITLYTYDEYNALEVSADKTPEKQTTLEQFNKLPDIFKIKSQGNIYKNSKDNYADYVMEPTLKNDMVLFNLAREITVDGTKLAIGDTIIDINTNAKPIMLFHQNNTKLGEHMCNLSKFPLCKTPEKLPVKYTKNNIGHNAADVFHPSVQVDDLLNGVTYFMLLASGYKLTSNKELPSDNQKFGRLIPMTETTLKNGAFSDSASGEQKYPMISILSFDGTKEIMRLMRIDGIMVSGAFTQSKYNTKAMSFQYFKERNTEHYIQNAMEYTPYGHWVSFDTPVIELDYTDIEKEMLLLYYKYHTKSNAIDNVDEIKTDSFNDKDTDQKIELINKYSYMFH